MKVFSRLVVVGTVLAASVGALPAPAAAALFTNTSPVLLPSPGPGAPPPTAGHPYPSQVVVSGLSGTVSDVNLVLHGFDCSAKTTDSAYPEDVDVLLVGPTGANAVLLSDVGGANDVAAHHPFGPITLRLDDQAATGLPADSQLHEGTWRPRDDDDDTGEWGPVVTGADPFPAPAPTPSSATALSTFNGLAPNGTWSLYVADDFPGPDNCTIRGGWTLDILTSAANRTPVAVDDTWTTSQDTTWVVPAPGVLANDSDPDGDPLAAGTPTQPAHGTVALGSDGAFVYTPDAGFTGTDTWTYAARDPHGSATTATVTMDVRPDPVNRPPVAVDDTWTTSQDTTWVLPAPGVLGNDSDPDGDPLSAVTPTQPAHGTVTLGSDGAFVYTPDAGFTGADTWTYAAQDSHGAVATAEVTMDVRPAPEPGQSVAGTVFYDADTDGVQDAGEAGLADRRLDVTSSDGTATTLSGADGRYRAEVPTGAVTVAQRPGAGWALTAPPGGRHEVTVGAGDHVTGLDFGNVCLGAGGAHGKGYWGSKQGQAAVDADEAAALDLLRRASLRGADGKPFDPTTYRQYQAWLKSANSKNAAYMLSAQLSALALDVHAGSVDPTDRLHAAGAGAADGAGFAAVQQLLAEADAALAANGSTTGGDPDRPFQLGLTRLLDAANSDRTFVQPTAADCPPYQA